MGFFVAQAWAAEAGGAPSSSWLELLPLLVIFVVFYLFLIRPQQKRQKEHRTLISNLAVGDEVVTSGGLVGRVTKVTDEFIVCQVGTTVALSFQKQAVVATLPKGTLKNLDTGAL